MTSHLLCHREQERERVLVDYFHDSLGDDPNTTWTEVVLLQRLFHYAGKKGLVFVAESGISNYELQS